MAGKKSIWFHVELHKKSANAQKDREELSVEQQKK